VDEASESMEDVAEGDGAGSEEATTQPATAGVSRTTLVVSVLVAAFLAGALGVAVGWKLEQQRVKDDVANIRPIGTVTTIDDDSVTIELETSSGSKTYEITDKTNVEGADKIEEGATILVRASHGGDDGREAEQIIVLEGPSS
jgi:hypothetical protein